MVTITFDPIETQNNAQREMIEAAQPLLSSKEAHPRRYHLRWANTAKNIIALVVRLVTPDRRQGKIEMGV